MADPADPADLAAVLARFAARATPSPQALAVMRLSLLDWAAVGIAGAAEPVARILRAQALEEGGAPQAGLLGARERVPARAAALVNGATSHALDYDDTHFAHIGHPSVAVVPAALAAGELAGADGAAFQRAALLGCEASVRVGVWLGRPHYQRGFHQTGTAGAFGATIAAACLLGLDEARTAMALGLVSTRASGLKSQFGTMGKPFNAGVAAQNGIEAALLARRGLVSRTAAVDGSQGFGPTHHGAGDMAGFEGLGRDWWMIGVRHKFHACCHGIHAALEAAGGIEAAPGEIAALEVAIHPRWLSVCNIAAPRSGLEAKFSYRVALALRLCGQDTARPGSFSDAACADPAIVALAARISVRPDERLGETQARLHLRRRDGGESLHVHDLASDPGLEARAARLRAKAVSLLGKARAARLRALIESAAAPAALAAEIGG